MKVMTAPCSCVAGRRRPLSRSRRPARREGRPRPDGWANSSRAHLEGARPAGQHGPGGCAASVSYIGDDTRREARGLTEIFLREPSPARILARQDPNRPVAVVNPYTPG